ncbi:MAG: BON domain-containing protein [Holophagales bacterium]|nr:BON domain-containing protein [Holophagales bacterium]
MKRIVTALVFALVLATSSAPARAGASSTDPEVSKALTGVAVKTKLIERLGADGLRIHVQMNGTTAVLTGQVEKKESQELAKEVALSVADVKNVDNRLTQNPAKETSASKDLELEIRDGILETKVKNILLTEVGTNAMKIEVEATNGVVSLRGTVPSADIARAAVDRSKGISGVKKVVNLLKSRA